MFEHCGSSSGNVTSTTELHATDRGHAARCRHSGRARTGNAGPKRDFGALSCKNRRVPRVPACRRRCRPAATQNCETLHGCDVGVRLRLLESPAHPRTLSVDTFCTDTMGGIGNTTWGTAVNRRGATVRFRCRYSQSLASLAPSPPSAGVLRRRLDTGEAPITTARPEVHRVPGSYPNG